MRKQIPLISIITIIIFIGCTNQVNKNPVLQTTGSIERLDPEINKLIPEDAVIEILAEGFIWSEGPLWLEKEQMLIFTDVPTNTIYQYSYSDSLAIYLKPSGLTGEGPDKGDSGGNGLVLDKDGNLIICQHGDRRVAKMLAPLDKPEPEFETLVDNYKGMKFNSPNDLVFDSKGNLYFTDPPYGLKQQEKDPRKEIPFNGVYKLSVNGKLSLVTDKQTRPNGIALSPDESKLYVANSDPQMCLWMVYQINEDETIDEGEVFFDATDMYDGKSGNADGMKINRDGYIFATGPGGVLVLSPEGKHLGTIRTGKATANCAFNTDESILYMTAHDQLMRIKLK
jgi:gluconolactonase